MLVRRWAVAALAVALAFTGTACGSSGAEGEEAAEGPQLTAAEMVTQAAEKVKGQPFEATVKWGTLLDAQGVQDGPGSGAKLTMNLAEPRSGAQFRADVILLGADMWLKMDFGELGKSVPQLAQLGTKWMHINATRLPARMTLGLRPGAVAGLNADAFLRGVTKSERVGPAELTGTVDLTKAGGAGLAGDLAKQAGTKATAIPFRAFLDDQGRVAKLVLGMPAVGAQKAELTIEYRNIGTAAKVTAPKPAETITAPDTLYQMFG